MPQREGKTILYISFQRGAMVASGDRPSPTEAAAETRPLWNPFCGKPGLSGPLRGDVRTSQVSLPFDLLGRVSHPRNSRQDKNLRLVGGGTGEALSAGGAFPTPTEPAGETSPPWGNAKGRWSPVATVHRRPRRQPRPRSPPLETEKDPLPCRGAILPRLVEAWEGVRGWARVILAPARLTRQEPLGSLQNSHFAIAKPRFLRPL